MRAALAAGLAYVAALTACSSTPVPGTPNPSTPGSSRHDAAAARYLAIARPANEKLDHAFDAFDDDYHDDLVASRHDLQAITRTERAFDRSLLAITMPASVRRTARALVVANEARAALTLRAARTTTLVQLQGYRHRLLAANDPVEMQVKIIRAQLGLPPPPTG